VREAERGEGGITVTLGWSLDVGELREEVPLSALCIDPLLMTMLGTGGLEREILLGTGEGVRPRDESKDFDDSRLWDEGVFDFTSFDRKLGAIVSSFVVVVVQNEKTGAKTRTRIEIQHEERGNLS